MQMKDKKHCKRILQLFQKLIADLNIRKALQKKEVETRHIAADDYKGIAQA